MKYTQQIIILVITSLTIGQVAQAACSGGKIGMVPSKLNLKEVRKVSSNSLNSKDPLVDGDPRTALDIKAEMNDFPEIASVVRVALNANGSNLTGSLVSKCHVLVNLHLLGEQSENSAAASLGPSMAHLYKLDDTLLATNSQAKVTVGFIPNGKSDFQHGFDIQASGRIVKTGRMTFNGVGEIPANEDWAIIRIDNPAVIANLVPLKIASENEIASSNKKGNLVGYPEQLIAAQNKQTAFIQECDIRSNQKFMTHNCVSTGGNSSSPFLINFEAGKMQTQKIGGIGMFGKYRSSMTLYTTGVPASAFRDQVEQLKKTDPCN